MRTNIHRAAQNFPHILPWPTHTDKHTHTHTHRHTQTHAHKQTPYQIQHLPLMHTHKPCQKRGPRTSGADCEGPAGAVLIASETPHLTMPIVFGYHSPGCIKIRRAGVEKKEPFVRINHAAIPERLQFLSRLRK